MLNRKYSVRGLRPLWRCGCQLYIKLISLWCICFCVLWYNYILPFFFVNCINPFTSCNFVFRFYPYRRFSMECQLGCFFFIITMLNIQMCYSWSVDLVYNVVTKKCIDLIFRFLYSPIERLSNGCVGGVSPMYSFGFADRLEYSRRFFFSNARISVRGIKIVFVVWMGLKLNFIATNRKEIGYWMFFLKLSR